MACSGVGHRVRDRAITAGGRGGVDKVVVDKGGEIIGDRPMQFNGAVI
jgi:hypothetical protein